ncbi:MAG: nuclear transport factor 2 family protein [Elusimicrobia bacterium]|jgi:hypothetical protein|nr:nuclear transport factor 2 family protein [Elusimicrobiota bacterium]
MIKKTSLGCLILLGLGAFSAAGEPAPAAPAAPDVAAEVTEKMKAMIAAAEKLDVDAAFAPLAQDPKAVFFLNAYPFSRSALLPFFRKAYEPLKAQSIRLSGSQVKVLGPDSALWLGWGTGRNQAKSGGAAEQFLAETWVWQRVAGDWQVVHYHESWQDLPSAAAKARVEKALSGFAAEVRRRPLTAAAAPARLRAFLGRNPRLLGSCFAVAPGQGPKAAPYVYRRGGRFVDVTIGEDGFDYTAADWYTRAAAGAQGPVWSDPYYDAEGGQAFMVTCSIPVYGPDGKSLLGVLTADLAL